MSIRVLDARDELSEVVCEVAEGPMWDARSESLVWVDINAGLIHRHSSHLGQLDAIDVGQHVGFVVPCGASGYVAGLRDGFAFVGDEGTARVVVDVQRAKTHLRMNDGKTDPAGRIWAGTMGIDDPQPEGSLYCLDTAGEMRVAVTGLTIPNGIDWSPDQRSMYFTDTTWGRIDKFDYDVEAGTISDQRVFVDVPRDLGLPDGLAVDDEGCVWVALWYGGAVHRYTPEGRLDTVVRIPALQATSCAFGGAAGDELYITSANQRLTPQEAIDHPRSGRVFVCRPGAAGPPARAYGMNPDDWGSE